MSTQLRKAKYTIDEMDQKLSMDLALILKEQVRWFCPALKNLVLNAAVPAHLT